MENELKRRHIKLISIFLKNFQEIIEKHGTSKEEARQLHDTFLKLSEEQLNNPYSFEPYHKKIRSPFDYYSFGNNFFSHIIDMKHSTVNGLERVDEIAATIKREDNVILFSNHQIEPDPQSIGIMLGKTHPELAEKIIYVAGERVVTDPLAIPFSMGLDLLCIYSKKYIAHPPEQKLKKQMHNKKTMETMRELLSEGGKIIWVAPSGGRDRRNSEGVVEVTPFDPQSIEMFYLMAKKSGHTTHFYPLALATYDLLPPPETTQIELGEERKMNYVPIHLAIGKEIDMKHFPGCDNKDKHERRKARAQHIYEEVKKEYLGITS